MTDEQQYLFNCLKNVAWDRNQLRRELECCRYHIFLDTKSLGKFLVKKYHGRDPLPKWAESFFDWDDFIKYGGHCNIHKLPDERWIHIIT